MENSGPLQSFDRATSANTLRPLSQSSPNKDTGRMLNMDVSITTGTKSGSPSSTYSEHQALTVTTRRTEHSGNILPSTSRKHDKGPQPASDQHFKPQSTTIQQRTDFPKVPPKPPRQNSAIKSPQEPTQMVGPKVRGTDVHATENRVQIDTGEKKSKVPPPVPKKPQESLIKHDQGQQVFNEPAAIRQHSRNQGLYQGTDVLSTAEKKLTNRPKFKPNQLGLRSAGNLSQPKPILMAEMPEPKAGILHAFAKDSDLIETGNVEGKEKKAPPPPKKPDRSKAILNEPVASRQHSTHQKPYQGSESSSVAERRWSSNHPDLKTTPLKMGSAGKLPQHKPSLTAEPKAGISHAFAKDSDLRETGNVEGKERKAPPVPKKPDESLIKSSHGQRTSSEPIASQPKKNTGHIGK